MAIFSASIRLNLIVKGGEVERINVIGTGTVIVEDTLIHTGVTHSAIVLREDYNSNFKGDVIFRDVTLETYNDNYVGLFWVAFYNYNTGLYYTDSSITWDSNGDGVADTTDSYHVQDTVKGGDDSKYYSSYLPQNVTVEGLTILRGGSIVTDENAELGGVYTRGDVVSTSDSKFMLALYNGRDIGFDIHEWNCDISKQGDSFKKGGFLGIGGTTYTVNHPIKPTEKVTNNTSYKVYEYVFNGKVYDNLKFLNNLVIE